MSTGQIAQRPYSSFRAKYGVTSSPMLGARQTTYHPVKQRNLLSSPITAVPSASQTTKSTTKPSDVLLSKTTPTLMRRHPSIPSSPNGTSTTTTTTMDTTHKQCLINPKSLTTKLPCAKSSWETNRTFYSSTRSNKSTSSYAEANKTFVKNNYSKSPNSSSGTSVESIAPKYGPSAASCALHPNNLPQKTMLYSGSQKRAYTTVKLAKENVPQANASNKKTYPTMTSSNIATPAAPTKRATKKQKENANSFSSKFPNGMPFEEEFYKGRSYSITSDTSKYSGYSSGYDSRTIHFEDEFLRKPSNEPLYVDFSKRIPPSSNTNTTTTTKTTPTNYRKMTTNYDNNKNFFCKFESFNSNSKNISNNSSGHQHYQHNNGGAQKVIIAEPPVVYVAVASWVPKCNRQQYQTNVLEPVTKDTMYVFFFIIIII